ncbi:MAG: MraY family glycosyltransferase [Planctomycetota bacterium]
MVVAVLFLVPVALAVALPAAWVARRIGQRSGALDTAPIAGQVKAAARAIPNTGGVAIYLGIAAPIAAGLLALALDPGVLTRIVPAVEEHIGGIRSEAGSAWIFLGAVTALHLLGIVDDRRPMSALPKLLIMITAALAVVVFTDTRLLTALDGPVGGTWASITISVLWLVVVTNAMNFLDNMDGLAAGVACVAGGCFLAATLVSEQWLIASVLALLIGSCLGFLWFNRPPATLFMGDGGSLVLGFTLGFLTVRTTYYGEPGTAEIMGFGWYGVFMPVVVLAIPLYDFVAVCFLRIRQGKSPFVGDLQHVSHRLVRRGMSKPAAVGVLIALTAVTGFPGVSLATLQPWQAALVGVQTLLALGVLAAFETASSPGRDR